MRRASVKTTSGKPKRHAAASVLLADRLHSAAIHLLRTLRTKDRSLGVGPARLSALSVLVFGGPCSLKRLAALEQVRPPTMSRIVAGLESAGLVTRATAPDDARRIVLRATLKGVRIMRLGRARRVEYLAGQLVQLPRAEQLALARALAVLEKVVRSFSPPRLEALKQQNPQGGWEDAAETN